MTETSLAAATNIDLAYDPDPHESREPGNHAGQPNERDKVIQYYGLARDPFEALGDVFLLTPKIEKLLRLLTHLTRFSHKLIVVTADSGVGKTCVAEQFLQQLGGDRDYCQINGLADDTPVQILREIAEQIGLAELQSANLGTLSSDIRKYAGDLREDGRTCLILIDDADLLSAPVLKALHDLVQPLAGEISPLHLVLFGRPQLEANLADIESLADDHHHVFHYQLSRFSFKECCQYLQICFSRAGDQARIPFSEADYLRIHQQSGGVPLAIVTEARLVLAEGVDRLVTNSPAPKWVLSVAVAFSLVATVLVGAFLWQQRNEQPLVVTETAVGDSKVLGKIERGGAAPADSPVDGDLQAANIEGYALPRAGLAKVVAGSDNPAEVPEDILAQVADQTIGAAEEIVEAELAAVAVEAQSVSRNDPVPADLELVDDVAAGAAEPAALSAAIETPDLVAVAAEEVEPPSAVQSALAPVVSEPATPDDLYAVYSASEQSILELPGGAYTLQLLGARTEQQVLEYIAPHAGENEFQYFRTELKGAPWYVVIYGSYPNLAAATAAGANLPKSLGVQQPWARKLNGIHQALRSRASSPQVTQQ